MPPMMMTTTIPTQHPSDFTNKPDNPYYPTPECKPSAIDDPSFKTTELKLLMLHDMPVYTISLNNCHNDETSGTSPPNNFFLPPLPEFFDLDASLADAIDQTTHQYNQPMMN